MSTSIHATQGSNKDVFSLSLQELMNVKVEVASKIEQPIAETPSTVSLLTKQDIQNLGVKSVEEILNYIPGFQVTRDDFIGSTLSIGVRGRRTNNASSDVLYLLNGQRLNDDFTGGALQFDRLLNIESIKQVEVIRGPGSALYGSNAMSGVVNIITDIDATLSLVEIGSDSQKRLFGQISGQTENFNYSLWANAFDRGEQDYETTPESRDDITRDPHHGFKSMASLWQNHWRANLYYSRHMLREFWLFDSQDNDTNEFITDTFWGNIEFDVIKSDSMTSKLFLSYRYHDGSGLIYAASSEVMQGLNSVGLTEGRAPFLGGPVQVQDEIEARWSYENVIDDTHTISAGLSWRRPDMLKMVGKGNYELKDFSDVLILGKAGTIRYYNDVIETYPFLDQKHRDIYGVYVQSHYKWGNNLESTIGVRFDEYSDFGSSTNPRAALVYQLNSQHTFKFMYGEAFRSPTPAELSIRNSPVEVGNPDLGPEESTNIELAWLYQTDTVFSSVTLFDSKVDDVIVIAPAGNDPRTTFVNGDTLSTRGIETELKLDITDSTSLRLSLTNLFEQNDVPFANQSRTTGSFALSHSFGKFTSSLNGYHHGNMYGAPDIKFDGYHLLNFQLTYEMDKNKHLTFRATNLTNEKYITPSFSHRPEGVANRDRSLFLGFSWHWK